MRQRWSQRSARRELLLLHPMLGNFAVMLFILPFVNVPMPLADLGLMLAVAVIAMTLLIRAYTLAEAALVAPMQYSQIICAGLFGWLFFDERSELITFVGAGIVIASGVYIVLRETGAAQSQNRPVLLDLTRRPEMGGLPRLGVASPETSRTVEEESR